MKTLPPPPSPHGHLPGTPTIGAAAGNPQEQIQEQIQYLTKLRDDLNRRIEALSAQLPGQGPVRLRVPTTITVQGVEVTV